MCVIIKINQSIKYLLHQEVLYMKHVTVNDNDPPRTPAGISCFRCAKPHYRNQFPLPAQMCPEKDCGRDHTKAAHSGYQPKPRNPTRPAAGAAMAVANLDRSQPISQRTG